MDLKDWFRRVILRRPLKVMVYDREGKNYEVIEIPLDVPKKFIGEYVEKKYSEKRWWKIG